MKFSLLCRPTYTGFAECSIVMTSTCIESQTSFLWLHSDLQCSALGSLLEQPDRSSWTFRTLGIFHFHEYQNTLKHQGLTHLSVRQGQSAFNLEISFLIGLVALSKYHLIWYSIPVTKMTQDESHTCWGIHNSAYGQWNSRKTWISTGGFWNRV